MIPITEMSGTPKKGARCVSWGTSGDVTRDGETLDMRTSDLDIMDGPSCSTRHNVTPGLRNAHMSVANQRACVANQRTVIRGMPSLHS